MSQSGLILYEQVNWTPIVTKAWNYPKYLFLILINMGVRITTPGCIRTKSEKLGVKRLNSGFLSLQTKNIGFIMQG